MIPDAKGTTCNQRLERVSGTEYTHILRVPFRTEKGILRKWISRFDVWPYLETYTEVRSTGKFISFSCSIQWKRKAFRRNLQSTSELKKVPHNKFLDNTLVDNYLDCLILE